MIGSRLFQIANLRCETADTKRCTKPDSNVSLETVLSLRGLDLLRTQVSRIIKSRCDAGKALRKADIDPVLCVKQNEEKRSNFNMKLETLQEIILACCEKPAYEVPYVKGHPEGRRDDSAECVKPNGKLHSFRVAIPTVQLIEMFQMPIPTFHLPSNSGGAAVTGRYDKPTG
ncbi:hypothetical protein STEG23_002126 [Scotinomys teguina]